MKLTFWRLRHSVRQKTTRTEEQLAYVETLGRQTETATPMNRARPAVVSLPRRRPEGRGR